jgi:thiamine biosynthesis lipoprotein
MILVVNILLLENFFTNRKTRPALLVSFLFLCGLLAACSAKDEHAFVRLEGQTMGTSYHITLVRKDPAITQDELTALQADIDAELQTINQHMSTYIPDSEIMQLNGAAVDEWLYLSEPLREVLAISQTISRKSDGAFDITVGPLINLWGFGATKQEDEKPSVEAIALARANIGYQHLEIIGHQVRKAVAIQLDLSAVAKGYGVDWVANFLSARGFEHYMVEIGGELRLQGLNAKGQPWRIAIEQPESLQAVFKAISLSDQGMATSGEYRNYFEVDGKRYSHTINPATGYPIEHNLASVTVIAPTCAEADAWATALNVLGPEKGMAIANKEKLSVYMIVKEGDEFVGRASDAFAVYQ